MRTTWCSSFSPSLGVASATTVRALTTAPAALAFVIGQAVQGGMYGEYPSLKVEDQLEGDLHFNNDFRCTYATLLEQWLGVESAPIVNGQFEQFACLKTSVA